MEGLVQFSIKQYDMILTVPLNLTVGRILEDISSFLKPFPPDRIQLALYHTLLASRVVCVHS